MIRKALAASALVALAGCVVGRQRAAALRRGLELRLVAAPSLPPARVDRRLVERVIENLLGNAIKFSPDGGRVELRLSVAESGLLRLEVADQGLGVSEKMRPRLFEKFARGDEPAAGTGLGLAFCRLAVEANGGRIWLADDGPETGATFALELPTV